MDSSPRNPPIPTRERMPNTNPINSSTSQTPIPLREEEEVNRFRESIEILDKFFKWLFAVIAFKITPMGQDLFITHPIVMMVIVLMIVFYFLVQLLGTMLPHRTGIFPLILVCVMIVIASVSSVLILTVVSSHVAWLCVMVILWVAFFAVSAYYQYPELYKFVAGSVSYTLKKLIDSYYKTQRTRLPV